MASPQKVCGGAFLFFFQEMRYFLKMLYICPALYAKAINFVQINLNNQDNLYKTSCKEA